MVSVQKCIWWYLKYYTAGKQRILSSSASAVALMSLMLMFSIGWNRLDTKMALVFKHGSHNILVSLFGLWNPPTDPDIRGSFSWPSKELGTSFFRSGAFNLVILSLAALELLWCKPPVLNVSCPVPETVKQPRTITLSPPCSGVGMSFSDWKVVIDRHQTCRL